MRFALVRILDTNFSSCSILMDGFWFNCKFDKPKNKETKRYVLFRQFQNINRLLSRLVLFRVIMCDINNWWYLEIEADLHQILFCSTSNQLRSLVDHQHVQAFSVICWCCQRWKKAPILSLGRAGGSEQQLASSSPRFRWTRIHLEKKSLLRCNSSLVSALFF